jgi:hypothetical protein
VNSRNKKASFPNMPRGRSADYSRAETLHFLNIALAIKPISQNDWEQVLEEHNLEYGDKKRSVDSLRRKFAMLHRKKIPTGDPFCPEEVRLAKRLKYAIGMQADIGTGEEDYNIIDGTLAGGEEEDPEEQDDDEVNGSGSGSGDDANPTGNNGNGSNASDDGAVVIEPEVNNNNNSGNGVVAPSVVMPSVVMPPPRARVLVTPRKKSASSETASAIQDLLQVQVVQMQQAMLRMEEERLERQQWKDMVLGAIGVIAQHFAQKPTGGDNETVDGNSVNNTSE